MTLDDLLQTLWAGFPPGATTGVFDAGTAAGGEYAALFVQLGVPPVLSLASADGWVESGGVVTLQGTSLTPIYGAPQPPVYFQLTPDGDDYVLLLDVTLPQSWTFPQAFTLLDVGVFRELRLASPADAALVVASGPAADPLRMEGETAIAVAEGLTFTGTFDVNSSAWAAIAWVASGGAPGQVTGPIAYDAPSNAVSMMLPLATGSIDHVGGGHGPSLSVEMSLYSGEDPGVRQYVCGVRFDAVLDLVTESGAEYALDVSALLSTREQGVLDLSAAAMAVPFPSRTSLARWWGPENGIVRAMPEGFGGGENAAVTGITLGIGLVSRTLEYAFLRVGALTEQTLPFLDGALEVGDLSLLFCAFAPLGDSPAYSFSFSGLVVLGGVPVRVQAQLPALRLDGALSYEGGAPSVKTLVTDVFGFDPGIPDTLLVDALTLSADVGQGRYEAEVEIIGSWMFLFGDDNVLEFESLRLAFSYDAGAGAEGTIEGKFRVNEQEFDVLFDVTPGNALFRAVWAYEGDGEGIDYLDVAIALGMYGLADPPQVLDLAFTGATFQLESAGPTLALSADTANYGSAAMVAGRDAAGNAWGFVFGMEAALDLALDLTDIPVVGDLVPSGLDVIALDDLRIVAATTALPVYTPSEDLDRILGPEVSSGLVLSIALRVGTAYVHDFSVRFGGADDGSADDTPPPPPELPEGTELPALPPPPPPPVVLDVTAPTTAAPGPQYNWVDVQRAFGPVQFNRIGFSITPEDRLALAIDGSVSLAGLTIALTGLSAEIPIESPYLPTFGLAGLAVEYAAAGLEIGGALVKVPGMEPAMYSGDLVLEIERFGALAFGSYTTTNGSPSLFAFVFLDVPLGGPGFFFVTGLAGGFGFNRSLTLPTIDTVQSYPLVQGAMGTLDARATIDALDRYIQPAPNEYWFAAGIRFTSYGLLKSYVLATVAFGATVEVGLMGESTLALPPIGGGEEAEGPLQPIAEADLVLLVDFVPSSGTLAVAAQLSPASYVLSKQAHLTGGFAFYVWFPPSPHSGDFVVSLGGYNPYFAVPAHYPAVPRLGFSWTLSTELSITGGVYCALTPSVIMAGGSLQASWQGFGLTAWFTAAADFLVRLKPFAYAVEIGVSVGVSYTLDLLLTTKTITVQVSGSVELWGQPFGGRAWVDASVVSFSFDFGEPRGGSVPDLDWAAFRDSFLPPVESSVTTPSTQAALASASLDSSLPTPTATDSLVAVHAPSGLLGTYTDGGDRVWRVDPAALRLVVSTQVPSKTATVAAPNPASPTGTWNVDFGVGPMGAAPADVSVALTITLSRDEGDIGTWEAAAVVGNVPAGVWLSTTADMGAAPLVLDALTGVELVPVVPAPDATLPVPIDTLLGDDPPVRSFAWSAVVPPSADSFDQAGAMTEMQTTLVDPTVSATRSSILAALRDQGLRTATTVDVSRFAAQAPELMTSPPQLRLLGETPTPSA